MKERLEYYLSKKRTKNKQTVFFQSAYYLRFQNKYTPKYHSFGAGLVGGAGFGAGGCVLPGLGGFTVLRGPDGMSGCLLGQFGCLVVDIKNCF